ncbi:MAG: DUF2169 domain-containing protein [Sandaracinaceae bacterium]|nr:DUF2169 domain-containing protein [Sandaracinaceae bacterium]
MRYVKDTPFEVGHRVYQLRPPTPSLTVIVKGSFDPVDGGVARISEEQVTTTGECFTDDDPERSQRLPSDFALLKPKGECFVIGKAWSQKPERMIGCSFKIGKIGKSFAVFGDRVWQRGISTRPTDAVPFTQMDIGMERAYGGPGFDANPWGRGREPMETDDGPQVMLPNVEDPRGLVSSPSSKPAPVVLGPLPVLWPARRKLAGTYDDKYMKTRWPWLPEDFDWRWFLEAPADQQLESGFWRGDEPFEAHNLHPTIPSFRSRMPGLTPRVFLDIVPPNGGAPSFREVRMYLDTITWDAGLGKLLLVWRGSSEIASESLDDMPHIFVAHEPLDARPQSKEELRARFEALLRAEEDEEKDAEGVEPPAQDEPAEPPERPLSPEELAVEQQLQELEKLRPPLPGPDAVVADPRTVVASLRAAGVAVPPELDVLVADLEAAPPADEPAPVEPEAQVGRALVLAKLAAGEPLRELDLTGADLSGLDLSRQDLSSSILASSNLENAILRGARLMGASLRRATLPRVDASGADLREADLSEAVLIGATLDDCRLEDADLSGASLALARLSRVKAGRALFVAADLTEAVLAEAELVEADLERARLDRADFRKANLQDATLEDASAAQARFQGAVMVKSRGAGLRAKEAQFGSIDGTDSFWERSEVSRADFGFAKLARADFSDAIAIGASFDGASLEQARFDRANAHSLRARKANLFEANFDSATLSFADLRGANLFGAEVWRAKLDNVQLDLADVTRTKLERK